MLPLPWRAPPSILWTWRRLWRGIGGAHTPASPEDYPCTAANPGATIRGGSRRDFVGAPGQCGDGQAMTELQLLQPTQRVSVPVSWSVTRRKTWLALGEKPKMPALGRSAPPPGQPPPVRVS